MNRPSSKYLTVAGRLESLIEAHRIIKGGDGDEFDRALWRLTAEVIEEEYQ